ncbi:outer membrane beta-barrel protein [Luteimonas granuli]|nr:outer membrane beta-barrel protein [Luteimonas granuli]
MNNKTSLLTAATLALALGATSLSAQAAEPVGWYAGAGVGQSMIDEPLIDDEDTAFQVFGGYQFHPNFGVELGYTDFGEVDFDTAPGSLEADTVSLVAVGTLPFTERFSGYAKAGFHSWDAEARSAGLRADDDGTDPTYGLGLQYRFTDNVALRGEYSRFEMDDADVDVAQLQVRFDF